MNTLNTPDWEQRRYEIAKGYICTYNVAST